MSTTVKAMTSIFIEAYVLQAARNKNLNVSQICNEAIKNYIGIEQQEEPKIEKIKKKINSLNNQIKQTEKEHTNERLEKIKREKEEKEKWGKEHEERKRFIGGWRASGAMQEILEKRDNGGVEE